MEGDLDKSLRRLYKNGVGFPVYFRSMNNNLN